MKIEPIPLMKFFTESEEPHKPPDNDGEEEEKVTPCCIEPITEVPSHCDGTVDSTSGQSAQAALDGGNGDLIQPLEFLDSSENGEREESPQKGKVNEASGKMQDAGKEELIQPLEFFDSSENGEQQGQFQKYETDRSSNEEQRSFQEEIGDFDRSCKTDKQTPLVISTPKQSKAINGGYPQKTFPTPLPLGNASSHKRNRSELDIAHQVIVRAQFCRRNGKLFLYSALTGIYQEIKQEDLSRVIMGLAEDLIAESGRSAVLDGVKKFLLSSNRIPEARDIEERYVCFQNGVLDLDTESMIGFSPQMFFTSRIEAMFDPRLQKAPIFDQYLHTAMRSEPALIVRVWEMLGYLLAPDNDGKCFFLLRGVGDSGKSVLGNVITRLFSSQAVANLDLLRLGDRFSTSMLLDKRINLCMDLPDRELDGKSIGILKLITGKDDIVVEKKYRGPQTVHLNCKLVFGSNHALRLTNDDEAFFNRLVEIPFLVAIPKDQRDPKLVERILTERNAIATIAILYYSALRKNGYRFSGQEETNLFLRQLDGLSDETDSVSSFVKTCCDFSNSQTFSTTEELHLAYQSYCKENGLKSVPDSNRFSRRLNDICGGRIQNTKQRVMGKPRNGYLGIILKRS